jgi:maltose alpha-D-glucosyltransferase/alpha-amylase
MVLCVANLSRTVQPVQVPLAQFGGLTPVEMLGQTEFPRITDQNYFLTLAPYGFYWFQLQEVVTDITARVAPVQEEPSMVPALFAGVVWDSILDGSMRSIIERQALVSFLGRQRWFGGKARPLASARFLDWTTLRKGAHPAFLAIVEAEYKDGGREHYALPLAMASGADATAVEQQYASAIVARVTGARKGLLYDGLFDDATCAALLAAMEQNSEFPTRTGRLLGRKVGEVGERAAEHPPVPIMRSAPDQSNTSVLFGHRLIMKLFRRLEPGPNPDVEIGEFLTGRGTRVPPLRGVVSYAADGQNEASLAMLQEYVWNQGNGWQVTIEELGRYFERVTALPTPDIARAQAQEWIDARLATPPDHVVEAIASYLALAEVLGRRTGELHLHLASAEPGDDAFAPEPLTPADAKTMADSMRRHAEDQLRMLDTAIPRLDDRRRELAREVIRYRHALLQQFDELEHLRVGGAARIRCHGDYHLGQVLVTEGDVVIIDFEGEPARPLTERRAKSLALRDVAGMLRSFSYAALTGLGAATAVRAEDLERLTPWADLWETWVKAAFLRAYFGVTRELPFVPSDPDDLEILLQTFVLDKALYELGYELNNRPEWVHIPLTGLLRLRSRLHA